VAWGLVKHGNNFTFSFTVIKHHCPWYKLSSKSDEVDFEQV